MGFSRLRRVEKIGLDLSKNKNEKQPTTAATMHYLILKFINYCTLTRAAARHDGQLCRQNGSVCISLYTITRGSCLSFQSYLLDTEGKKLDKNKLIRFSGGDGDGQRQLRFNEAKLADKKILTARWPSIQCFTLWLSGVFFLPQDFFRRMAGQC